MLGGVKVYLNTKPPESLSSSRFLSNVTKVGAKVRVHTCSDHVCMRLASSELVVIQDLHHWFKSGIQPILLITKPFTRSTIDQLSLFSVYLFST